MKKTVLLAGMLFAFCGGEAGALAQTVTDYTAVRNVHSHNDYCQNLPFYTAYSARCASIEADIFAVDGELYVAHERKEIDRKRTLRALYLDPIRRQMELNVGKAYPDGKSFQLLIDLKTGYAETMPILEKQLEEYLSCFDTEHNPSAVQIVITGNQPAPADFAKYASFIQFDGQPDKVYTAEESKRVALLSAPFFIYSEWNGLGRMVEGEYDKVKTVIDQAHKEGKKIRFWGCPDTKTAWNTFMKMGVDYINTDRPELIAGFLNDYPAGYYSSNGLFHDVYQPTYASDNAGELPQNVIVLISDGGAGQAQMWAAATANGGDLNLMQMRNIALVRNNPTNDYTTDSAGAGTALATGVQTRNRRIGTDPEGNTVANITEKLEAAGVRTGIVTNDGVCGATPSAYFAHQPERNFSQEIAGDLLNAPVHLVVGAPEAAFAAQDSSLTKRLRGQGVKVTDNPKDIRTLKADERMVCLRGDDYERGKRVIEETFEDVLAYLSKDNDKGFFLMVEGAKVDKGGHGRNLSTVIDEYLSFDKVVGKALKFADEQKNTLVIVLSDHETGGLTLLDGDYKTGTVMGQFATNDHTGIPVLLYAYGPSSQNFRGFFRNFELEQKIMKLYNSRLGKKD